MILLLLIFTLLSACSDDDNPTGSFIEISNEGLFALALATHSPDDRVNSTIRADKDTVLVVSFFTRLFSVNASEVWHDADNSFKHGVYLYYLVEDGVEIVAVGGGRIVDAFDNKKKLIQPGESYRYSSSIDSAWFHNNGTSLFYTNFLFEDKDNLPVKIGKVKMEGSAILKLGNVLLTKEKLFALSQQGLRE